MKKKIFEKHEKRKKLFPNKLTTKKDKFPKKILKKKTRKSAEQLLINLNTYTPICKLLQLSNFFLKLKFKQLKMSTYDKLKLPCFYLE